jgi:uncharacterized protein (DUF1330 family)
MAAYLIADVEIHDPQTYKAYQQSAPATIAAHGGRYLVRGGATEVVEGSWSPKRCVILEFPSMAQLRAWYDSSEYLPLRELRKKSTRSNLVMVEGL